MIIRRDVRKEDFKEIFKLLEDATTRISYSEKGNHQWQIENYDIVVELTQEEFDELIVYAPKYNFTVDYIENGNRNIQTFKKDYMYSYFSTSNMKIITTRTRHTNVDIPTTFEYKIYSKSSTTNKWIISSHRINYGHNEIVTLK